MSTLLRSTYLGLALVLVTGAIALLMRCHHLADTYLDHSPAPTVAAVAIATASSRAVGTQSGKITIPLSALRIPGKPASQNRPQAARAVALDRSILPAGSSPEPSVRPGSAPSLESSRDADLGEVITIEFSQAIAAESTAAAQASASVKPGDNMDPQAGSLFKDRAGNLNKDHSRLGVLLATMPGLVALDVQLLQLELPPWVIGAPLEVGVDVAANLQSAGIGGSVGSKAFALAGGWVGYQGGAGLMIGAGVRF